MPSAAEQLPPASTPVAGMHARWAVVSAMLIVLATAAAFSSSFIGAFVVDDETSILRNPSIRQLWPMWSAALPARPRPDGRGPAAAEPLAGPQLRDQRLSALELPRHESDDSHFRGAAAVRHCSADLSAADDAQPLGAAALPLALVVALLWAVHPLQTESVTYIVQCAESLTGLLYLLTLYCFIRAASVEGSGVRGQGLRRFSVFSFQFRRIHPSSFILPPAAWYAAAVLACLLGMASKEVMMSAPVIVLLYDRTFCAGSFRESWRRRYAFYLCLAGTWALLAWLILKMSTLGTDIGPGTQEFTWWSYLLTQPGVIVHYLQLAFWPSELCIDYSWPAPQHVAEIVLPATWIVALLGLTVWAIVKRPAWGFLGAWFFAILAPTSSFVPLGQAAFEHRMYLPLAAVVTAAVVVAFLAGQWLIRRDIFSPLVWQIVGGAVVVFVAATLAEGTFDRNLVYKSHVRLWEDTVAKAPENAKAQTSLGTALLEAGRPEEAVIHFRKSLEIRPDNAFTDNNLAAALVGLGQLDEAIAHYQKVLEAGPNSAEVHYNLGVALRQQGRIDEAIVHFRKALEIKPDFENARRNLNVALGKKEHTDD